jgi:hypothetical protein
MKKPVALFLILMLFTISPASAAEPYKVHGPVRDTGGISYEKGTRYLKVGLPWISTFAGAREGYYYNTIESPLRPYFGGLSAGLEWFVKENRSMLLEASILTDSRRPFDFREISNSFDRGPHIYLTYLYSSYHGRWSYGYGWNIGVGVRQSGCLVMPYLSTGPSLSAFFRISEMVRAGLAYNASVLFIDSDPVRYEHTLSLSLSLHIPLGR